MSHAVLQEDWSEYDNRKIRDNRDRSKFSCDEDWEVSYLVGKLARHFPSKTTADIRRAIRESCSETSSRTRETFVTHVVEKLR